MGGLLQTSPTKQPEESSLRPVLIGVLIVAVVVTILVLILRAQQKPPAPRSRPEQAFSPYLRKHLGAVEPCVPGHADHRRQNKVRGQRADCRVKSLRCRRSCQNLKLLTSAI